MLGGFYNFLLCLVLENDCGVYLGSYLGHMKDQQGTPQWMRWVRLMMGQVLSTYTYVVGT